MSIRAAFAVLAVCSLPISPVVQAKSENPRLIVNPRMGLVSPGRPIRALAQVVYENPGPDWYCPAVTFKWAEGFTSSIESDCLPYEQLSEDEKHWFRASRSMNYGPGEHTIVVLLEQGTRRKQLSQTVYYQ